MCGTSRLSEGDADTTKRWYLGYMKHCTIENWHYLYVVLSQSLL
jgi:hypothetical protein